MARGGSPGCRPIRWPLTVWVYDPEQSVMDVVHRAADHVDPPLTGVDNVVFNRAGELFVAEDGGNMEIVLITPDGVITPFLRIIGQDGSEIAGPAFDPPGTRLYFSSMRGPSGEFSAGRHRLRGVRPVHLRRQRGRRRR
jgi:secreted PhoX family phosphatase